MTAPLDAAMVARAAPPGSMRYLATLFTPVERRALIEAIYVIEAEILAAARGASHDVAHTRLNWWRAEIDRLVNAVPQHPATRVLFAFRDSSQIDLAQFHEVLTAADMELARMTFATQAEVESYAARCGGVVQQLITTWVATPDRPSARTLDCARRLGAAIRGVETLRDLRQDVTNGHVFVPLERLAEHGLAVADLRAASLIPALRNLLAQWHSALARDIDTTIAQVPRDARSALRHSIVLARLHQRLLKRIRSRDYDVAASRIELGSFERVWAAWRAARSAI